MDQYVRSEVDPWSEATANWIDASALTEALVVWSGRAHGCAECASSLGALLLSSDADWNRESGLPLVRTLVETCADDALVHRNVPWMLDFVKTPNLLATLGTNSDLLSIVDRYASIGDSHALQAREILDASS